jgi:hypothetical protein
MRFPPVVCVFVCFAVMTIPSFGQSPNGKINGLVSDPTNAAVTDADIVAVNDVTGVQYTTKTNADGIYVLSNLPPGPYRVQVSKIGFKTLIKPDIILNVQGSLSINFGLLVGAFHETVTVQGGAPLVDTEDATVSTVVDRQFAENLPMNGRSFQSLIELTPGTVVTPSNAYDGGQFSVNGQRASSNYWTVDGVSANIGVSSSFNAGNGLGGALGAFSALGGTNSLVSIDAMQEFRIQTSTYAPEFGRTPGAQISIVTRSGTNQFHGSAYNYLRNDLLDANDWFADQAGLPKPEERQNDFGGTFSGPILRNKTFFFFSYEGLRLRLPQSTINTVPDSSARQNAITAIKPYLNAFPIPNGPEILGACDPSTDPTCPPSGEKPTGVAQFSASYSNAASLDAYSIRLDHQLNNRWNLFGRYSYSPSSIDQRGSNAAPLSDVSRNRITTQTATFGATWAINPFVADEARFNYSQTDASSRSDLDGFGGAVPLTSLPLPSPFTSDDSAFQFFILPLKGQILTSGRIQQASQRQLNLVDNFSVQKGRHGLKFGIDYRRLAPIYDPRLYLQAPIFFTVASAEAGSPALTEVQASANSTLLFHNVGAYAQDTWRATNRLTLTYGLRWDLDSAPSSTGGPNVPGIVGYNSSNLSGLGLASAGTPPFQTSHHNLAPRLGLAYQLSRRPAKSTVARGGFGVFYDLASSEVGSLLHNGGYPFSALNEESGPFPLAQASAEPPAITTASLANCCNALVGFDPHLELPYSLQWNVAIEQGLGEQQSFLASYIGASGKRLLQTGYTSAPNSNLYAAMLVGNTAASSYNALQLQFQRHLSAGLQILASYTWSHSIDDASAGSNYVSSNAFAPSEAAANRGSSDFDVRHSVSAGITYEIPIHTRRALANAVLSGWSFQSFVLAHSSPPVDVSDENFFQFNNGFNVDIRPDLVPGEALYLYGQNCRSTFLALGELSPRLSCPGGKGFNPAAFTNPPVDPNTGNPLRQGNLPRNFLRGFSVTQWDFGVHREFPIRESLKCQFRAEMFNLLNHPNFGQPNGGFGSGGFGLSSQTLGQSLNVGNLGGGGLDPLYQIGGPRSIQFALKLTF